MVKSSPFDYAQGTIRVALGLSLDYAPGMIGVVLGWYPERSRMVIEKSGLLCRKDK
ncbi:MAG: hypothetical protein J7K90_01790 [Desulfuromusa sp.]|nr:hypothetical protein [Desulfuromusa sp.]